MKRLTLFSFLLFSSFIFSSYCYAQSMGTKKIIAKYATDYIPEFKSSLAYRSNNPALANIDIVIDFASFGDNSADLDLAVRQMNMAKGAILFLAKDAVGKEAIEKGLKTITIRKASNKAISYKGGNLTLAATDFELKNIIGTPEIQKFLEKNL